jgi:hypothetical protein
MSEKRGNAAGGRGRPRLPRHTRIRFGLTFGIVLGPTVYAIAPGALLPPPSAGPEALRVSRTRQGVTAKKLNAIGGVILPIFLA